MIIDEDVHLTWQPGYGPDGTVCGLHYPPDFTKRLDRRLRGAPPHCAYLHLRPSTGVVFHVGSGKWGPDGRRPFTSGSRPPDWEPIVVAEGGVLVRIAALLMTKAEAEFFEQALYDMHQDTCIQQLLRPRFRTRSS